MFAQLMREMLTPTTFESFRVYSLDTIARMQEALLLSEDVRRGKIPQPTLLPVIEEIEWSVEKDPVAKELAGAEILSLLGVVKNRNNFMLDHFMYPLRAPHGHGRDAKHYSGLSVVGRGTWVKAHRLAIRVNAVDRERKCTPGVFESDLRWLGECCRDHLDQLRLCALRENSHNRIAGLLLSEQRCPFLEI
ncbi:hypothetical protein AGR4C_Lc70040 [Agrobacterium tumefaciens str. Kerr 14]|uniref:Uncharacterized protein n=1 Tax=Agrobacterium tumefaciens str. Kerr 14 TaxID=1183424 RepID=A0A1S7S243_AGRTU|nr:hypothetical protein AGR4C_Lc70040 [Agrobacterium tumefaciens str. Kerr 14]